MDRNPLTIKDVLLKKEKKVFFLHLYINNKNIT